MSQEPKPRGPTQVDIRSSHQTRIDLQPNFNPIEMDSAKATAFHEKAAARTDIERCSAAAQATATFRPALYDTYFANAGNG